MSEIQNFKTGCIQRKRLGVVGELEFRQPITKVDNCNIADVLFISQIYNVKPELKHNKEQMLRLYSSSPNNAKPNVGSSYTLIENTVSCNFFTYFLSPVVEPKKKAALLSFNTNP